MKPYFSKLSILTNMLVMFSVFTISIILSSCNKEDIEGIEDKKEFTTNDNYYVKYIIKAPGPYGRFSNWTASTPDGTYSNSGYQVRSWEQTYGPVKKEFNCRIQIGHYQGGTPTIEIHVAKNQEPFALKTTKTGNSASYTIY